MSSLKLCMSVYTWSYIYCGFCLCSTWVNNSRGSFRHLYYYLIQLPPSFIFTSLSFHKMPILFPFPLSDHLYPAIPLHASPTLCNYLPHPLCKAPSFPISLVRSLVQCYSLFYCSLPPSFLTTVLLYFPGFCGYYRLCYVFTHEDLEPGASDKREHGDLGSGLSYSM